jgi:hypothetical protein
MLQELMCGTFSLRRRVRHHIIFDVPRLDIITFCYHTDTLHHDDLNLEEPVSKSFLSQPNFEFSYTACEGDTIIEGQHTGSLELEQSTAIYLNSLADFVQSIW